MRLSRIYLSQALTLAHDVTLDQTTSHYLIHVLRLGPGAELIVFNGQGGEFQATLKEISRKIVTLHLVAFNAKSIESPLKIELGQALSQADHWRFVLQKSVELGVAVITPLITERSQRFSNSELNKKMTHWQAILQSAAEQSGRTQLPLLNEPCTLSDWLNRANTARWQIMAEPTATQSLHDLFKSTDTAMRENDQLRVLIGAEGGFSAAEKTLANAQGLQLVHLGPRVLRTETATVALLSLLQYLLGDL